MYILSTPVGVLRIAVAQNGASGCQLWCDDRVLGSYTSANSAAQAVSFHQTADERVDALTCELPSDVEGWKWRSIRHKEPSAERVQTATCG
jgi:hypothetical protein